MRTSYRIIYAILMCSGLMAGCSSSPPVQLTRPIQTIPIPSLIPGVPNFANVSPVLYRGEQPTAAGFGELQSKYGIKTVIDLRTTGDDIPLLKQCDKPIQYLRIHAKPWHPENEDLIQLLRVLRNPVNCPVFIHCAQGADRTGWFVASYRIIEQGWQIEDALFEMQRFGYHPIWFGIPPHLRNLDADAIRKQVDEMPEVPLVIIAPNNIKQKSR